MNQWAGLGSVLIPRAERPHGSAGGAFNDDREKLERRCRSVGAVPVTPYGNVSCRATGIDPAEPHVPP